MSSERAVIVLPTFNEAESLETVVAGCLRAWPSAHVLVVDDASPDGTGRIADGLASTDSRVEVHHRPKQAGLASAYVEGFGQALARGYDIVVQMDADGSHDPDSLRPMIAALETCDLVIGSRYLDGGTSTGWPWYRRAISETGSLYARVLLRLPVRDATSGYKVWRSRLLRRVLDAPVEASGYVFQVVTTFRASELGARLTEIPIRFAERSRGRSKFGPHIVFEATVHVAQLATRRALRSPAAARVHPTDPWPSAVPAPSRARIGRR